MAENRFEQRMGTEEEFNWLLADIAEYNSKSGRTRVSLLESQAREEMAEEKAKLEERKAQKKAGGPLVKSDDVLAEENINEYGDEAEAQAEDSEDEEGPDLLLREAARIVGDVAELESNLDLLNLKFSQLNAKKPAAPQLN